MAEQIAANYTPAVGDVVELTKGDYYASPIKAILFISEGHLFYKIKSGTWGRVDAKTKIVGKIGSTDKAYSCTDIGPIAKAYFSKPTFTGSYEEQQAQAVAYYKWKFGSKIKMVKRNNLHAGGSRSLPHSQEEINKYGSFGTILMIKSDYIEVQIGDASSWSVAYTCLEPVK